MEEKMILETKTEKIAFDFVCNIASELTSNRGCNDLEQKDVEKFKGLTVDIDDEGNIIQREIVYDFDILYWLQTQVKSKKLVTDYGAEKFIFCGKEITINQYRDMIENLDTGVVPMPILEENKIRWIYPKSMCKRFEESAEDVLIDEDGNRCCVMCSKVLDEEKGDSENACAKCN